MWRTLGASVIGSSHVAAGGVCEDAFAHWQLDEETVVLAVADGAGSASRAHEASQAAVQEAVAFCRAAFEAPRSTAEWEAILDDALSAAQVQIGRLAASDSALRELATTLQLLLASRTAVGYARIGDGGCVVLDGPKIAALGPRPGNEYVNETEFLTSPSPFRTIFVDSRVLEGVALFTDGLQSVAMRVAAWEAHEPFFRPLFAFAGQGPSESVGSSALTRLLSAPGLESRTDDDRTLLLSVWSDVGR